MNFFSGSRALDVALICDDEALDREVLAGYQRWARGK